MTVEGKGADIETESHDAAPRVRREQLLVFAAAALIVVSLFLEGAEGPDEGASGEQIRTQLEDGMGALSLQVLGGSLAFLGFVLFTVGIRALARRRGGDPVLLDLTLLAGGLIAVWMWFQASVDAIPLVAADDNGQLDHYADTTLPALDFLTRLGETFGDIATVPRGLFVLAVSLLSLQTRLLPRWIGLLRPIRRGRCPRRGRGCSIGLAGRRSSPGSSASSASCCGC